MKSKKAASTDLSDEARELLMAYFRAQERYDLQFSLGAYPNYTGEEVVIIKIRSDEQPRFLLLPERDRVLQSDMNAKGPSGENLVILPRSCMEKLYAEIFEVAFDRIRKYGSEPKLTTLKRIVAKNTVSEIFGHEGVERHVGENGISEIFRESHAYIEFLRAHPTKLDPDDACVLVFIQYLVFMLEDAYQPCVDLAPENPFIKDSLSVDYSAFIKYSTNQSFHFKVKENVKNLVFGFCHLSFEVPQASTGSSHFRLRAPIGLVFTKPLRISKVSSAPEIDRNQIQLYRPSKGTGRGNPKEYLPSPPNPFRQEKLKMQVKLNQTIGTRLLLLTAYLLVTITPPGIALIMGDSLNLTGVELTSTLLLPVVVALVAASWSYAHLRTFAVIQLMVFISLLGGWILALNHPGVAAFVIPVGGFFVIYNLVEIAKFPSGLDYEEFADTLGET